MSSFFSFSSFLILLRELPLELLFLFFSPLSFSRSLSLSLSRSSFFRSLSLLRDLFRLSFEDDRCLSLSDRCFLSLLGVRLVLSRESLLYSRLKSFSLYSRSSFYFLTASSLSFSLLRIASLVSFLYSKDFCLSVSSSLFCSSCKSLRAFAFLASSAGRVSLSNFLRTVFSNCFEYSSYSLIDAIEKCFPRLSDLSPNWG